MDKVSKRLPEEVNETTDPETQEIMTMCSSKLDSLMSEFYGFVDCCEDTVEPLLPQPCKVEPGLAFHFVYSAEKTMNTEVKLGRKPILYNEKFKEEITPQDLATIAVTGEWVLGKRGVYTTGREKRSELITGASHSPSMKKSPVDSLNKKKHVIKST